MDKIMHENLYKTGYKSLEGWMIRVFETYGNVAISTNATKKQIKQMISDFAELGIAVKNVNYVLWEC